MLLCILSTTSINLISCTTWTHPLVLAGLREKTLGVYDMGVANSEGGGGGGVDRGRAEGWSKGIGPGVWSFCSSPVACILYQVAGQKGSHIFSNIQNVDWWFRADKIVIRFRTYRLVTNRQTNKQSIKFVNRNDLRRTSTRLGSISISI